MNGNTDAAMAEFEATVAGFERARAMTGLTDAAIAEFDAAFGDLLGIGVGALVKTDAVMEPLLGYFNGGRFADREEFDDCVVSTLEMLEVGLETVGRRYPWPGTPLEILHSYREWEELRLATLQRWSLLRDGFTRLRVNDVEAAQESFAASAPWASRQRRALDMFSLMLQFLERDDPSGLDMLTLDDGAQDLLGLGQQTLGPRPQQDSPFAAYRWSVEPVPRELSAEAAETMSSRLLTSAVGSRAEALCQELAVSSAGKEQFGKEISEFAEIVRNSLDRLVESRADTGDLLSALASVILGRVVDLSATDIGGWASGRGPWNLYYPTIDVDLSVPLADNQWYLLPWPERAVLLRALKDHLQWSQIHFTTVDDGSGIHADLLAWRWFSDTSSDPDSSDFADLPDPTDPRFRELLLELDAIAGERDHALANWERRVGEEVGRS